MQIFETEVSDERTALVLIMASMLCRDLKPCEGHINDMAKLLDRLHESGYRIVRRSKGGSHA